MWLRKEIQSICLKEFQIRHQLDLIQESPYIAFNIDKLIALGVEYSGSDQTHWQHSAARCNFFWFNIVGYLKLFPRILEVLREQDFCSFEAIVIRKETSVHILRERIQFGRTFVEIARTIAYRAHLKAVFAKSNCNINLFNTLSRLSNNSDPAGEKLIALSNRILFIKDWIAKIIAKHQDTIESIHKPTVLPIFPDTLQSIGIQSPPKEQIIPVNKTQKRRIVSIVKPFIKFSSKRTSSKSRRLSDILDDDSDSSSSNSSLWSPPFPKPN